MTQKKEVGKEEVVKTKTNIHSVLLLVGISGYTKK